MSGVQVAPAAAQTDSASTVHCLPPSTCLTQTDGSGEKKSRLSVLILIRLAHLSLLIGDDLPKLCCAYSHSVDYYTQSAQCAVWRGYIRRFPLQSWFDRSAYSALHCTALTILHCTALTTEITPRQPSTTSLTGVKVELLGRWNSLLCILNSTSHQPSCKISYIDPPRGSTRWRVPASGTPLAVSRLTKVCRDPLPSEP